MGKHDRDFAGKLKEAWDTRFSQCANLVLVLCGSVSAWIDENILRNTGFVDRPSLRIRLPQLPLHHCNQLVWPRDCQISAMEKLRMLAVTGGVPRYLEEVDANRSSVENLQRLCWRVGRPREIRINHALPPSRDQPAVGARLGVERLWRRP